MAYITPAHHAVAHPADKAHGLFGRLFASVARHMRAQATRRELSRLSDRELADIGIARSMIDEIARGAVR